MTYQMTQAEINEAYRAENAMVADDERRADEEAAAYDPTYACPECGAVMAERCRCLRARLAQAPASHERRVAYSADCPWENPAVVGPAILELWAEANGGTLKKLRALYLPGMRLSPAGERSSNPGGLWITSDRLWESGDRCYYGRINADGSMRMTREWPGGSLAETLKRLAAFGPMELARIGKAAGRCCYCGRELTDPISVALGYGPVCAGYHGLPHSAQAAGLAA